MPARQLVRCGQASPVRCRGVVLLSGMQEPAPARAALDALPGGAWVRACPRLSACRARGYSTYIVSSRAAHEMNDLAPFCCGDLICPGASLIWPFHRRLALAPYVRICG